LDKLRVCADCIEIPVALLERAKTWYQEVLGLDCVWSDDHHAMLEGAESAGHSYDFGLRILLVETQDPARLGFLSSHTQVVHGVIDLKTEDIEAFHRHLKSKNVNADDLSPPASGWAPRGFGFLDSEGNRLGAFSYSGGG
jgi:catechol 2,3-dioxygenase-like lactoylglutathione lyase family enzyme